MERTPVIREFAELRQFLNHANKLSNQKAVLKFEIEHQGLFIYELFAISKSQSEAHRICLARKVRRSNWERTGYTRFKNLESYCATFLNEKLEQWIDFRTLQYLPQSKLEDWSKELGKILEMLFLKEGYEP